MKRISITAGSTVLYAGLNDTLAAEDFQKRLPCTLSATDSGMDFCCPAAKGVYDPMDLQTGWKNGDLSLCDGWFAILYSGQEVSQAYRHMMIIGHLEDESLDLVKEIPRRAAIRIDFA